MDYLVDFTLTVPEGTPAFEQEERMRDEGTRVAELATQGHAVRVWKPLGDEGLSRAIGLYRAADDSELQAILESLPLWPWMEISVTALAEHPNDPALSPLARSSTWSGSVAATWSASPPRSSSTPT